MPERMTHKKASKHGAMYMQGMHGSVSSHPAKGIATTGGKHAKRHGKAGHVVHQGPVGGPKRHAYKTGTAGYKRGKSG